MSKRLIVQKVAAYYETLPHKGATRIDISVSFAVVDNGDIVPFTGTKIGVSRIYTDEFFAYGVEEIILASIAADTVIAVRHEMIKHQSLYELWDYLFEESVFTYVTEALTPKVVGTMASGSTYSVCNHNFNFHKPAPAVGGASSELSRLSESLPGKGFKVSKCPADNDCPATYMQGNDLLKVVIHLNDYHKWGRDQIADWADKLHDDGVVDLSFRSEDD